MSGSEVVVYSRRGCHLCEDLLEELAPLLRGLATLTVRDIDSRPDWRERYDTRVPVVAVDGTEICDYFLDRTRLAEALNGRG